MLNCYENDTLSGPKFFIYCLILKKTLFSDMFLWNSPLIDSLLSFFPSVWSYWMLSAESLKEILLLSVSIQFLLILEVIADRVTSPSCICRYNHRGSGHIRKTLHFSWFINTLVTSSHMQLKSIVFVGIKFLHSQTVM